MDKGALKYPSTKWVITHEGGAQYSFANLP